LFRRKLGRPDSDFLNVWNGNKTGRKWFSATLLSVFATKHFNLAHVAPTRRCAATRNARRGGAVITGVVSGKPMPVYAEVVRDSRRKWREPHPDYQRNYWQTHPDAAARNRQQQRQRDQKRRVSRLVRNTVVIDPKRSAAEVWLVGPLAADLVKNTMVPSKLLILQSPLTVTPSPAAS
jgi:hypothetical protein